MRYWIMKSEPTEYSWDDLNKEGQMYWYGVRNYKARNNMGEMKVGDLAFFYHSNEGKEIVGVMEIVGEAYQDPTTDDVAWTVVDVAPKYQLKKSVTLADVKANPNLKNIELVRLPRLSVVSVKEEEWKEILKMSEV